MKRALRRVLVVAAVFAVGACTEYGEASGPSALQPLAQEQARSDALLPPPTAMGDTPVPAVSSASAPAATQSAAVNSSAHVQFAPIIGASAGAVPALSARLRARATQRGITVATANDPATAYVMKGYFSAFTENRETTVIYVWDVLDPSGNRLHRIQGQQKQPGSGEGWAAVKTPTMEAIADRTIDDLAVWLSTGAG